MTFEHQLQARRLELKYLVSEWYPPFRPLQFPRDGAWPEVRGVVLERKFTDRFPAWMHEMAQLFNLQRTSVAKYVRCVDKLHISQRGWVRKPSRIAL